MGIEAEDLNNEENIDLAALANADDQGNNDDQGGEEVELSPTEQKAYDQGWRPQEDFNGPEDNWKTAKEYVRDGEFLATIKQLNQRIDTQEQDFSHRLDNSNKLHEARRKQEISDLKQQQREAVVISDTDAYDSAQSKIDDLEKVEAKPVPQTATPQQDKSMDEWNQKNPWFFEGGEKANDAKTFYNSYADANPKATTEQVLKHLDKKINQMYPVNNNPRREQPNVNETPNKSRKRGAKGLSMGDLTSAEKQDWAMFGQTMFKDEATFLKAVSDARTS